VGVDRAEDVAGGAETVIEDVGGYGVLGFGICLDDPCRENGAVVGVEGAVDGGGYEKLFGGV